jgi:hypothetical protein
MNQSFQSLKIYFSGVMEDTFDEIRFFVLRLISGEDMNDAEDLQFYNNNKIEIESLIKVYDDDEFPIGDINFDDDE